MVTGGVLLGGETASTRQLALLPPKKPGGGEKVVDDVYGVCRRCGERFEGSGRGRPRLYCSSSCKRAVEFEVRGIRDQLAETDDLLAHFDGHADSFSVRRV